MIKKKGLLNINQSGFLHKTFFLKFAFSPRHKKHNINETEYYMIIEINISLSVPSSLP